MRLVTLSLVVLLCVSACSSGPAAPMVTSAPQPPESKQSAGPSAGALADELFPDVLAATATRSGDGTWQFSATVSSPYDSPDRYADAWRVIGPDGAVLGVRELTHDHASEQPFTRSLTGVDIPLGLDVVTVEGRDQINGWGGATVDIELQR